MSPADPESSVLGLLNVSPVIFIDPPLIVDPLIFPVTVSDDPFQLINLVLSPTLKVLFEGFQ